jgi:hypothetical protein
MDTNGFLTIRQLVMTIKNRGQDYSMTHYKYWYQLVIDALNHLNIFTSSEFKVAYLVTDDKATVPLPNDYIDYIKIGVIDRSGRLWTLTLNPRVLPVPFQECGEDLTAALEGRGSLPTDGVYLVPHFWGNSFMAARYSLGGGFNAGYYNIDRQGRNLILSGIPSGTTIVLEYKSTGVSMTETTLIRKQSMEAVVSWCMMTAQQFGVIKSPINWEQKHYGDLEEFDRLEHTLTIDEYNDIIYGQLGQGPKR